MNSKFYVSYETKELLIEKGYPIEKDTPIYNEYGDAIGFYPADRPTKAEVMDWLERKGLVIVLSPATILQTDGTNIIVWRFYVVRGTEGWYNNYGDYSTRLEAEEAAIIKACKLLENGN